MALVAETIAEEAATWLGQRCLVEHCAAERPEFAPLLARCDALIVRTYTTVDEALIAAAPRLRVVGRAGVGLDNVDVEACRHRGIVVVHTPDANTQAVVEYVFSLLADALRPRVRLSGPVSVDEWTRLRATTVGRRQMNECTLGVLGLGRIGRRVAEIARTIGMRVLFNDLLELAASDRFGAEPVAVGELFERSDVVSIHIDGRPENRCFVGAELLQRMRPEVVFINTSRGAVVDHAALAEALRQRPQARALLDVHDPEPPDHHNPLLGLSNAALLPHLASRTESAMRAMSWVVKDVWRALGGV